MYKSGARAAVEALNGGANKISTLSLSRRVLPQQWRINCRFTPLNAFRGGRRREYPGESYQSKIARWQVQSAPDAVSIFTNASGAFKWGIQREKC
jgi:hypothetical protein